MKKILIIAVVSFVSSSLFAATTAKCFITLTSDQGGTDVVKILEQDDRTNGYESGFDSPKMLNSGNPTNLNIYSVQGTTDCSTIRTNSIAELPIIIGTNALATSYTLTFSNVSGTVKLFDTATATEIDVTEGGTYNFDAAISSTIADRFIINHTPAPVVKSFCFRNNILEINGYKDDANVKIDDAAVAITSDNFTREFTAAEAGRHKLTIDGKDYLFDAFPSNVIPFVPAP